MLLKRSPDVRSSEITDKRLYVNRRQFLEAAAGTAAGAAVGSLGAAGGAAASAAIPAAHGRKLPNIQKSPLSVTEKVNSWEHITTYNNFYEFGIDKDAPSEDRKKFN